RRILEGRSSRGGLSSPCVHRLSGAGGHDALLAVPQEPGPPARAFGGRRGRHSILVRRPGRGLRSLVPAARASSGLPPEPVRPRAWADRVGNGLALSFPT